MSITGNKEIPRLNSIQPSPIALYSSEHNEMPTALQMRWLSNQNQHEGISMDTNQPSSNLSNKNQQRISSAPGILRPTDTNSKVSGSQSARVLYGKPIIRNDLKSPTDFQSTILKRNNVPQNYTHSNISNPINSNGSNEESYNNALLPNLHNLQDTIDTTKKKVHFNQRNEFDDLNSLEIFKPTERNSRQIQEINRVRIKSPTKEIEDSNVEKISQSKTSDSQNLIKHNHSNVNIQQNQFNQSNQITQRNQNDIDFFQSMLSPSQQENKQRNDVNASLEYISRDVNSLAHILKSQNSKQTLFKSKKRDSSQYGSWKEAWTPEWRRKMAQRNADVELYESTKFSELDFLHQFDEILQLVVSNKVKLGSNEEKSEFETHLLQMKRFIDESLRQGRVQNLLLKGKLKRREEIIEDQRKKFFHELMLLREELFRTRKDTNYIPSDYSLTNWAESPLEKIITDEVKEDEEKLKVKHKSIPTINSSPNKDLLYNELKKQTENVTQTLQKLKELEQKRLEDIEEMKKKQEESELMRKQLEEKSKEIKLLQTQLDEEKKKAQIVKKATTPRSSISSIASNEQPSLRKASSYKSIFIKTEKMLDRADNRLTKKLTEASTHLSLNLDQTNLPKKNTKNLSIDLLEKDISQFQESFKDVYHQMNTMKERMAFYTDITNNNSIIENKEAPTGFVAIVFTDVESSTELWEESIHKMRQAILIHNKVIRDILEKISGAYEVKTEGDAFMCSFPSIISAVTFALQIQEELLKADWPLDFMNHRSTSQFIDDKGIVLWKGLRVRVGIHAGDVIAEQDPTTGRMDYFGPVVNKAARIEGCARGGEIAISSIIHKELVKELPNLSMKIHFRSLGSKQLKGIEGKEEVFIILPEFLKERPFYESKPADSDRKIFPVGFVNELALKHKELELGRRDIQKKAQYQMRMKSLEEAMKEKDSVIRELRNQLIETKNSYDFAEKTNDYSLRAESERKNTEIQAEISKAMKKFNKIVKEYSNMKDNYDNIVKLFDHRMKEEISQFKRELYRITGVKQDSSSSDEEDVDDDLKNIKETNERDSKGSLTPRSMPSIFMDKGTFKKNMKNVHNKGSMNSLTSMMKTAIREANNMRSGMVSNIQSNRTSIASIQQEEETWQIPTPRQSNQQNLQRDSLSPRSELIRKRAMQHLDGVPDSDLNDSFNYPNEISMIAPLNSTDGIQDSPNNSKLLNDSTEIKKQKPPIHKLSRNDRKKTRLTNSSISKRKRPSTASMMKNYVQANSSQLSQTKILAQEMNLPIDASQTSGRSYNAIVIPHPNISANTSANISLIGSENKSTSFSKSRNKSRQIVEVPLDNSDQDANSSFVKDGQVVGSYSRMLTNIQLKSKSIKDRSLLEAPSPLEAVDLINVSSKGYQNMKSRNVRTLLKIVDRGRTKDFQHTLEGDKDPHKQFIRDTEQSLKAYYEKKIGDGLHYDKEYIEKQSKIINPSNVAFGTLFDEIASMRRIISNRLEKNT